MTVGTAILIASIPVAFVACVLVFVRHHQD